MANTPKTIVLKGCGIQKEAVAAGTITPGMLVALQSGGTVAYHATAGGKAQRAFAVENELEGEDIDDNYVVNDNVVYEVLPPGAEVYALVAASAPAIVKGDLLESDGTGCLRKIINITSAAGTAAAGTVDVTSSFSQSVLNNNFATVDAFIAKYKGSALAIAIEAVDNSAGSAKARIKVEVL